MKSILKAVWQSIPIAAKIYTIILIAEITYFMSTLNSEGKCMLLIAIIALFPIYILAMGLSIINEREKERK